VPLYFPREGLKFALHFADHLVEAAASARISCCGKDLPMLRVIHLLTAMALVCAGFGSVSAMQTAADLFEKAQKDALMHRRVALFTEALALDADLVDALRERGILYYYQGKYREAAADLTAYLEKGGGDIRGFLFRALVSMAERQWEEALSDLNSAHALDPKRSDILAHRALVSYELKRLPEAERDVTAVLGLHEDPAAMAQVLAVRARIYADRGDHGMAREVYRQAAALDPTLGIFQTWGDILSPEQASRIGLLGLIVLPALLIFRITLPKPKRRDPPPR